MANRKKYILGNWKLNKNLSETVAFFRTLNNTLKKDEQLANSKSLVYGIAPTFMGLQPAQALKKGVTNIIAQDVSAIDHGSYTGQVSCKQLKDYKIKYCILGHSETRKYLGVTDKIVNEKVLACLANDIKPIICIGESLEQYNKKQTKRVLTNQLKTIFKGVKAADAFNCIIAYEPLWAIGSGKTPSFEEISALCSYMRSVIKNIFNASVCYQMPLLYGGSVNENNALDIITLKDVDGLLIGGVSLDASKFSQILTTIKKWKNKK